MTYLEHRVWIQVHAIVRLYAFLAEVNRRGGPMGIVVVDGYEYDIF